MLTTNNQDTTGQHLRLSHFIKNMAAYTAKYKLHEALELIIVDYNSNPALPPLWEAPTLVLPNATDLPLLRFITITHAMHKVSWQQQQCWASGMALHCPVHMPGPSCVCAHVPDAAATSACTQVGDRAQLKTPECMSRAAVPCPVLLLTPAPCLPPPS
jgi:hypothetical protein